MPHLRTSMVGKRALAVSGLSPDRSPVSFDPGPGRSELLFLTSSCEPCRAIWSSLAGGAHHDAVVVTPDAATENRAAVAALAGTARVVMSTEAWLDYGIAKAPWAVVVEDGVVVADGPADAATNPSAAPAD